METIFNNMDTIPEVEIERTNAYLRPPPITDGIDRSTSSSIITEMAYRSPSLNRKQTTDHHSEITVAPDRMEIEDPNKISGNKSRFGRWMQRYSWKMRHYFYIHMIVFILLSLLGGLVVWLIENYSESENRYLNLAYIDAWFFSSTCVFSCGLTSADFARLSLASQLVMMVLTLMCGITVSTLPALLIKARKPEYVRDANGNTVKATTILSGFDGLPTLNFRREAFVPISVREQLDSLPTPEQLRHRAYFTCFILIISTCSVIYIVMFIAIGGWLQTHYQPEDLLQLNTTVNPWYVSFIFTVTGFNQNGLSPFSDGVGRFVNDVFINLALIIVVMSGTSLFPIILRSIMILARQLAPWRHKVIFNYIILNNHRLSTLLFPTLQTRIYFFITIMLNILGVVSSAIFDSSSAAVASYSAGQRFLVFLFQTVNTRFAGFQSVDISTFTIATLLIYLLLMIVKPQMLCALDESPLEIYWLTLETQAEVDATTGKNDSSSIRHLPVPSRTMSMVNIAEGTTFSWTDMTGYLRRQSIVTKNLARQAFSQRLHGDPNNRRHTRRLKFLRTRLFIIRFLRVLIKHTFSFFIITRTWLFVFIFLICAIECNKMAPIDPNFTLLKVIFEIISAFGTVGLSLGYPNVASSFSTILSIPSKIIVIVTMLMGRHRGLLESMKDQEVVEYSAAQVLNYQRDLLIKNSSHLTTNMDSGEQPEETLDAREFSVF